ncbi:type VI secretion system protein ImpE [Nitrosomonas communis]|uniref:Type VI secretion system protein ImpE n=2 Tax=Nitrosomonas communis TaxID=44574 RepID=A0A1H2V392_9PROT|nr:type VI secretion system protein ImpE [Nitrosomonas communis]
MIVGHTMTLVMNAEQSLQNGDPVSALKSLQEEVRLKPNDAKLRIFLFQLYSLLGQWERALNQLEVIAQLDDAALAMVQAYREAITCEALRAQVFAGKTSPMVLGAPDQWLAFMIEARLLAGQGKSAESHAFLKRAFEEAPTSSGTINDQAFTWIADADMRLGPVIEAIINGRYYWVPFSRLTRIVIDAPEDLRDLVWMPAHLWFDNGGESVALMPTRYPGTETSTDGQLLLARKTIWEEPEPGMYCGLGQRIFTTDNSEIPLMDTREIRLDTVQPDSDKGTIEGEAHG